WDAVDAKTPATVQTSEAGTVAAPAVVRSAMPVKSSVLLAGRSVLSFASIILVMGMIQAMRTTTGSAAAVAMTWVVTLAPPLASILLLWLGWRMRRIATQKAQRLLVHLLPPRPRAAPG